MLACPPLSFAARITPRMPSSRLTAKDSSVTTTVTSRTRSGSRYQRGLRREDSAICSSLRQRTGDVGTGALARPVERSSTLPAAILPADDLTPLPAAVPANYATGGSAWLRCAHGRRTIQLLSAVCAAS